MDQKQIMIGLLMFVFLAFGGLIFYDVKYGHKFEKYISKSQSQWKWDDSWDGNGNQPQPPTNSPPSSIGLTVSSYAESLQKSSELGKPVLVFFTADWCTWCKKMKSETIANSQVQSVLGNYILVYVDADKDRSLAKKFGVESLPSYVITNSKEDKLKTDNGFKNADTFANWLNDSSLFNQPKGMKPEPEKKEPEKKTPPKQNNRPQSGGG